MSREEAIVLAAIAFYLACGVATLAVSLVGVFRDAKIRRAWNEAAGGGIEGHLFNGVATVVCWPLVAWSIQARGK